MPTTTQELVTLIKNDFAADVGRTKILSYLNRAQKELFNTGCAQMVFLNKNDTVFPYPILSTTAGTLSYDIIAANLVDSAGAAISLTITDTTGVARDIVCSQIKRIFLMVNNLESVDYNKKFYGERFTLSGLNSYWNNKLYRCAFFEVPGDILNRTEYSNARFQFTEDPGTHTDRYFVEFYYGCPELDSESVPMSINVDTWQEALICAVNGYIEQWRNGRTDLLREFRTYWKPKYKDSMNSVMPNKTPLQMPIRSCA